MIVSLRLQPVLGGYILHTHAGLHAFCFWPSRAMLTLVGCACIPSFLHWASMACMLIARSCAFCSFSLFCACVRAFSFVSCVLCVCVCSCTYVLVFVSISVCCSLLSSARMCLWLASPASARPTPGALRSIQSISTWSISNLATTPIHVPNWVSNFCRHLQSHMDLLYPSQDQAPSIPTRNSLLPVFMTNSITNDGD